MKRLIMTSAAALTLLLGGCATTIRSDVTTFHQWPAELQDKTYVIEAAAPQDDTLELRSYQNLVRAELAKLGFRDAGKSDKPAMTVAMRFTTTYMPVRVIETMPPFYSSAASPFFFSPYYRGYGHAYYGMRRSYWSGFHSPFYDPFFMSGPVYEERIRHTYRREVKVAIKSASDGHRLFDVTVNNTSREMSTPQVMPALVQSAFAGFPGVSGQARTIELKREG